MSGQKGYIEIKGTQENVGLTEVRKIFSPRICGGATVPNNRDGLVTCGKITPKAKQYMDSIGKIYVDRIPLEMVLEYDIL